MSEDRGFALEAETRFLEMIQSTLGGCDWPGCLIRLGCEDFPLLRAEERSFELEAEVRSFDLEAE